VSGFRGSGLAESHFNRLENKNMRYLTWPSQLILLAIFVGFFGCNGGGRESMRTAGQSQRISSALTAKDDGTVQLVKVILPTTTTSPVIIDARDYAIAIRFGFDINGQDYSYDALVDKGSLVEFKTLGEERGSLALYRGGILATSDVAHRFIPSNWAWMRKGISKAGAEGSAIAFRITPDPLCSGDCVQLFYLKGTYAWLNDFSSAACKSNSKAEYLQVVGSSTSPFRIPVTQDSEPDIWLKHMIALATAAGFQL